MAPLMTFGRCLVIIFLLVVGIGLIYKMVDSGVFKDTYETGSSNSRWFVRFFMPLFAAIDLSLAFIVANAQYKNVENTNLLGGPLEKKSIFRTYNQTISSAPDGSSVLV